MLFCFVCSESCLFPHIVQGSTRWLGFQGYSGLLTQFFKKFSLWGDRNASYVLIQINVHLLEALFWGNPSGLYLGAKLFIGWVRQASFSTIFSPQLEPSSFFWRFETFGSKTTTDQKYNSEQMLSRCREFQFLLPSFFFFLSPKEDGFTGLHHGPGWGQTSLTQGEAHNGAVFFHKESRRLGKIIASLQRFGKLFLPWESLSWQGRIKNISSSGNNGD